MQQSPSPQDLMHAYWDKLGKTDKLYARVEHRGGPVPSSFEQLWLEKPMRLRSVVGDHEERVDGDDTWSIDNKKKTFRKGTRQDNWCNPLFEPFFNLHHFGKPEIAAWTGKISGRPSGGQALVLHPMKGPPTDARLFVDMTTHLPLSIEIPGPQSNYTGTVLELNLNPKWKFDWPSIAGYTEVGG